MATTSRDALELKSGEDRVLRRAAIAAGDVYFPEYSMKVRRRQRLVCGSDEDAVTMAIEAAQRALALWPGDASEIAALFIAVGHGPEIEGTLTQVVREALGLRRDTRVVTFAADQLAAIAAVQSALSAVASGQIGAALVVASAAASAVVAGFRSAGAGAVVVAPEEDAGHGTHLRELARASGLIHEQLRGDAYEPDMRFLEHRYRALATEALGSLAPVELDALAWIGGPGGIRDALDSVNAFPAAEAIELVQGADFGVAGPLLAAVEASVRLPGRRVGLLVAGSGQVAILRIATAARGAGRFGWHAPPSEPEPAVALGAEGPALSLPVDSPFFARSWGESLRLEGAACTGCDQVVFPPSQRMICSRCGGHTFQARALARDGTVLSQIENRFLPPGFASKVVYVLAELDDGGRYWAPVPAEVDGARVQIGHRVSLRLRRFTVRDGVPVYSMKFVPEDGAP